MIITFEFPMRGDRDRVRGELTSRGFSTNTPLARIGSEQLLEVFDVADEREIQRIEEIVLQVARASRRVPNDEQTDT
jgi:hypothetical protein